MKTENYNYINALAKTIKWIFSTINNEIAEFIASQSAVETAYGKSTIFKENNNLFGMKMPNKRITTAFNENRGHAQYTNFYNSVIDYFLRLQTLGYKNKDLECNLDEFIENYAWLKYCPNENYLDTIKQVYKSYKEEKERRNKNA